MIKVKTTTKITGDKEYKAFIDSMKSIKGSYVAIGIQGEAGTYPDGTDVVQVGFWNEFGTEDIPERSFIRSTMDAHEGDINAWRLELVRGIADGKITVQKALDTLGFRIRELIRNTIKSNVPPPNAPATIAQKARDGVPQRTLMHTELLMRSIEFKTVIK